jgi:uncharacterized membrane protein (UPF0127 family)
MLQSIHEQSYTVRLDVASDCERSVRGMIMTLARDRGMIFLSPMASHWVAG